MWNLHLDVPHFNTGSRCSRRDEHGRGDQGANTESDRREEAKYILRANQTRMHIGKWAWDGSVVVLPGVVEVQGTGNLFVWNYIGVSRFGHVSEITSSTV